MHDTIAQTIKDTLRIEKEARLYTGRLFMEKKKSLNHGQWLLWLRKHDFKPRMAQEYMKYAREKV